MAGDRHSGQHPDPALLLAIRSEMEGALHPVRTELAEINQRLARGDTSLALLHQRVEAQEKRCVQHEAALQPKTEKHRRDMNPILAMLLSGVLSAVGTVAALWLLTGLGQQAAKGGP